MELNEFIANFANVFDDTDESAFTPDCKFQELDEWGSLPALGVIAFVKTEYDKKITGTQIRSCETIEDLFKQTRSSSVGLIKTASFREVWQPAKKSLNQLKKSLFKRWKKL